jgi:hypothetical protein
MYVPDEPRKGRVPVEVDVDVDGLASVLGVVGLPEGLELAAPPRLPLPLADVGLDEGLAVTVLAGVYTGLVMMRAPYMAVRR